MKLKTALGLLAVSTLVIFGGPKSASPRSQSESDEKTLEMKARDLHARILSVDTHCDTPSRMAGGTFDVGERHEAGKRESGLVDLPRMVDGGLDALFFGVFVGQGELTPEGYAKAKERALQELDAVHAMAEKYPSLVGLATTPDDAYRLKKEGKRIAFMGMENGYPIGKDLSLLFEYYRRGIRYLTLCHSGDNDICDSSTDRLNPEDRGLSDFGKKVVAECNRLGIMIDVSHISDKSFADVLKATRAPVIASHSCCRNLCDNPRNLSDDMIRALAKNGGVIQMCFLSAYLKAPRPNPERDEALKALEAKYGPRRQAQSIRDDAARAKAMQEYEAILRKYPEERAEVKDIVDHIDHVIKLVGPDSIGIGTDFDGGGGVTGCSDVSQMYRVTMEMMRRGYPFDVIEKVWSGNIIRVLRKVIEASRA